MIKVNHKSHRELLDNKMKVSFFYLILRIKSEKFQIVDTLIKKQIADGMSLKFLIGLILY